MRRLRNLLQGLPEGARCRKEDPDEPAWGLVEELLAQVIEEVSVLAAERRRPEPRHVPRPVSKAEREAEQARKRHGGLFDAALAAGRVRTSG